jgi:hypothetical protein
MLRNHMQLTEDVAIDASTKYPGMKAILQTPPDLRMYGE